MPTSTCAAVVEDIQRDSGLDEYEVLYTEKEYKKGFLGLLTDDGKVEEWLARST